MRHFLVLYEELLGHSRIIIVEERDVDRTKSSRYQEIHTRGQTTTEDPRGLR